MIDTEMRPRKGWARPPNSRLLHYFVQVQGRRVPRSLCENWLWAGSLSQAEHDLTPLTCPVCFRRLQGRRRHDNEDSEESD